MPIRFKMLKDKHYNCLMIRIIIWNLQFNSFFVRLFPNNIGKTNIFIRKKANNFSRCLQGPQAPGVARAERYGAFEGRSGA